MTSSEKARNTRHHNSGVRAAMRQQLRENRQSICIAMRRVLDNPSSTPEQLVRAAELLVELER